MSERYFDLLMAILEERGIRLPEENVRSAAETHEKLHHEFEKLRSVHLDFLPKYIEPMQALRWIESFAETDDTQR